MRAPPLRLGAHPRVAGARVCRVRHATSADQRARREGAYQCAVAAEEARPGSRRDRTQCSISIAVGSAPRPVNDHNEETEIVAQVMPYGSSWEEELNLL